MRPRVLVIAEACNPEWASVPLVGWQHATALRDVADVHIVTQIRNRDAILRAGLREGSDFTAIDSEAVAKVLWKFAELARGGEGKGWTTIMALTTPSHYWFEHLLWREFKRRIQKREFDIVHRVTPLSPTVPSLVAERCKNAGVPFVIGPLNGGIPWPKGFNDVRHAEREWLSHVRDAYKLLPYTRRTRDCAAAIIAASRATWDDLPANASERMFYVPENAVDPRRFSQRREPRAEPGPLRLVFVGRLVPYKGADMVIEAAAPLLASGTAVLEIIGDGPERERLEAMVRERGLESSVTMAGWVEHKQLNARLVSADVLAFPSVREFGGGVVLEAMAVGLVPVVVDYGGPGELVTQDTGVALPMGPRHEIVADLRRELTLLAADRARVERLSAACIARVESSFTWSKKAEQVSEIYRWVLGRGPRPMLPLPAQHHAPALRS